MTDEIEILPSPDFLEVDEHGVWTKLEPALVYLIDPATNEISEKIRLEKQRGDGIGVGDGSVWTQLRDGRRTDRPHHPSGRRHVRRRQEQHPGRARRVCGQGLGPDRRRFDAASHRHGDEHPRNADPPAARGTDLGAGPSGIWVVSSIDHVVVHLDAQSGAVLSTTELAGATDVAVDDEEVWVVAVAETVMIDPTTGTIDVTVPVGGGIYGSIALTEDTVWIRGTTTFVTRIDRATGDVIEDENSAVYAEIESRVTSGGDIVVGFGSVWTSAFDDGKLFRISTW